MGRQARDVLDHGELLDRCLTAFLKAGTLDLSLDKLAAEVRVSKRMLVHYFSGREAIEHGAIERLEDRLRAQFSPESFPAGVSAGIVLMALWDLTTASSSRGVLLLTMDISRRAWNGSERARSFVDEQQKLWKQLLMKFIPDAQRVEAVLQLFQGAVLAYLVTGDAGPGRRSLLRLLSSK